MDKVLKCTRCPNPGVAGTCPFSADVHDQYVECDCCEDCRHECMMDI